ncbi:MAG: glycosyltransferase [Robiginitomaculum sp.]|nr:glycosyltransferase [Robiginitomaculum sp.]
MRILITNNTLNARAGTEMYVRDLALSLKDKGITAICYSPKLGRVADELRDHEIEAISDLQQLTHKPDLIHAHHFTASASAFFALPQTPAVFVCHGLIPWSETPLIKFQQIKKFIAVDQAGRDRLINDLNISTKEIAIIQNGVDLKRFHLSNNNDPSRNKRALVFSNQAQDASILPLANACVANGIQLDVIGSGVGKPIDRPERILGEYGLVFAKGRAAIEAMACGCNVILADYGKWGGAVTPQNWLKLRTLNFGLRAIDRKLDENDISNEISNIKWEQGKQLAGLVVEHASLASMTEQLIDEYQKILSNKWTPKADILNEVVSYTQALAPLLYERDEYATRLYQETKMRLGNEATSAGLLVQAMVTLRDGSDQILVTRLAEQILKLQPGHPIALEVIEQTEEST